MPPLLLQFERTTKQYLVFCVEMFRNCAGLLSTSCYCVVSVNTEKSQMGILYVCIVCVSALCLISLSKRYIDISHSIMTFDLCFCCCVCLIFWRKKRVGKTEFDVHFESDIEFICNVQ